MSMSKRLNIIGHNFHISDEEYLDDLKRAAVLVGKKTVTHTEYGKYGKYNTNKLSQRFGSWKLLLNTSTMKI